MFASLPYLKCTPLLAAIAMVLALGLVGVAPGPAAADDSQWKHSQSNWGSTTGWNHHWRSSTWRHSDQTRGRTQIIIGGAPGVIVASPGFTVGGSGFIVHQPGFIVRQPGFVVGQPGLVARNPGLILTRPQFALKQKQFFRRHPSLFLGKPGWRGGWSHKRWKHKRWQHPMQGFH